MTRPRVLCVDDSEAILALERAVLGGRYAVSTASDGRAALAALARERPDCVLLDLSMPVLDGDEVLAALRADPALRDVPVVVVSSEVRRAEACLAAGATAFLPKPVRGDALLATVAQVLAEAEARRRSRALAVLPVGVGPVDLALPLEDVVQVALMPETAPLAGGPPALRRLCEVRGRAVAVLDLARALGVARAAPLLERRLVVLARDPAWLAVDVDRVLDPLEVQPAQVLPRERLGGADHAPLRAALRAVVPGPSSPLPVLDVVALLDPPLLAALPGLLATAAEAAAGSPATATAAPAAEGPAGRAPA